MIRLGFRSFGWSIPFGTTGKGEGKVSELVAGTFPTILDLGVRVNRLLLFGVYLGFNYGAASQTLSDACSEAVRCSVSSFRFGGQVQLYLTTERHLSSLAGRGRGLLIAQRAHRHPDDLGRGRTRPGRGVPR